MHLVCTLSILICNRIRANHSASLNVRALQHATSELRSDREIVLAAVSQSGIVSGSALVFFSLLLFYPWPGTEVLGALKGTELR